MCSYDESSGTNWDIGNKYMVTIKNKFDTLQEVSETHTPIEEYENFVTVHIKVAAECIPTKPRAKCRVPYESRASLLKKETQQMPMQRNLKHWEITNIEQKEYN